jgi:ribosomal protein S18 acetylase RimI-like enzyme
MENLNIKLLGKIPVEQVHRAFTETFSDYEVSVQMSFERFAEMMKTRDLNPDLSVGCFDGDLLVGFILTGFREIFGKKVCYDGGTGVLRAYRRKGIGEMLLKELLRILHEKQISRFVLEVLENNTPAIKLYEKYGFEKTRKLECFEITKHELQPVPNRGFGITITNPAALIQNETLYSLYPPSWQNEIRSVLNVSENYTCISLSCSGKILGYGFIHKTKGDIPQIGILEEWKYWGIEAHLVAELARQTKSEKIIVLNVEFDNYLGETLRKLGFRNTVNQWEMALEIEKNQPDEEKIHQRSQATITI